MGGTWQAKAGVGPMKGGGCHINIFVSMAHEDDFIILRILDDTMRRFKNHLKTFVTKLTNA